MLFRSPNALVLLTAFDKKFLTQGNAVMNMTSSYLDFLNENTAWRKQRMLHNTSEHKKASYIKYVSGMPVEKGYKSEVLALSFRDNPDVARGKDASLVLMEEAGKWRGMKNAFSAIKPTVEDGEFTTGQIIIFGTGGKDNTDWEDFKEIFYNPEPYNILPFKNIWDDGDKESSCGFFFPDYLNKPGHIDKEGNSDFESARKSEENTREYIKKSAKNKSALNEHITEYCFTPSESFQYTKGKIFNIPELEEHINWVENHKEANSLGTSVELIMMPDKKIEYKLSFKSPVSFPFTDDVEGTIMIYEHPEENPPYGLYTASLDPIEMDKPEGEDFSLSS